MDLAGLDREALRDTLQGWVSQIEVDPTTRDVASITASQLAGLSWRPHGGLNALFRPLPSQLRRGFMPRSRIVCPFSGGHESVCLRPIADAGGTSCVVTLYVLLSDARKGGRQCDASNQIRISSQRSLETDCSPAAPFCAVAPRWRRP